MMRTLICSSVVALLVVVALAPSSMASADLTLPGLIDAVEVLNEHQLPELHTVLSPSANAASFPAVFMHGMGDAGSNPGMQSLCKTVSDKYPGTHVACLNVANGLKSITTKLADQVEEFATAIRADPLLKDGFNAVGLSQGNLVVRGYVNKYNDPPVKTFISICGPHNGVATCPDNILYKMICPLWKIAPYGAPIAFSDYWKDPSNKATYLQKSRWLADQNNERDAKNATYKAHMTSLTKYVLVEALNDTMVIPHQSETHGYYAWGGDTDIVELRDTDGYKGDWIGLKTLDAAQKLATFTYVGDHLRFSSQFWSNKMLPFLQ